MLKFLHRPELRAARPGVDCHFGIRRRDGLPRQHPDLRNAAADAAGKILRTGASPGEGPEGVLDYPVLQGLTIALAVLVSLTFLLTDILQAWLDPRIAR